MVRCFTHQKTAAIPSNGGCKDFHKLIWNCYCKVIWKTTQCRLFSIDYLANMFRLYSNLKQHATHTDAHKRLCFFVFAFFLISKVSPFLVFCLFFLPHFVSLVLPIFPWLRFYLLHVPSFTKFPSDLLFLFNGVTYCYLHYFKICPCFFPSSLVSIDFSFLVWLFFMVLLR